MIVLDKKKFRTNSYLEKDNYRKMKFMKEKSKREWWEGEGEENGDVE